MVSVGFIGLGLMGKPMSKRLLSVNELDLVVYNRSTRAVEELVSLGAERAGNPKEVAERSEKVITMLPDSADVKQVILGRNGVAEGMKRGGIVIDCSTISPMVAVEIAEQLRVTGVEMLDAPVTGGTIGAEAGTLTFMVGGSAESFERCVPLFKAMGKHAFHMGRNGFGSFTKLCNQIAVSLNLLGTCEALLLASKVGLEPLKTIEALSTGAAASWMLVNLGPKMVERDFRPGFKMEHFMKDLRIVSEVCEQFGLPAFGANLVHGLIKALEAQGLVDRGVPLITALEKLANYEIKNH